ncbi:MULTISPECIES: ABC transporter ATP-binding protein [unclassified Apibacter]|uniref:ABC transporter ATP-binding protein n=1 Tax=unclassified Apibacter TaxID=2630820 RepID=UPI0013295DF9|nr:MULTISPECIES: ABC transporter ATP-binding protein [unclassified Apibacter]MCX8676918.1 ABC transporter ATP-binding protein [Apibacter sp. B3919]MXO24700.1 ATP-binding cassette domain-containing protein [Apibacter sp. B3924]MXO25944.1 ATP-binding cassette domain-containing protein [Apibacter sp. B3813]MXO27895.1 ATP-binding cassette domain-containing protein [Apibacter sp. B3913]MXO29745.1 ATP-binding cassette domain-containing protein [Apibacter sp. B3912]
MSVISIQNISKTYTGKVPVEALQDISIEINKGELFGLIGPDGAGKTTLFRILTTLLVADKGEAFVDGFDVNKNFLQIRERVGYMPGKFSLYQDLSIEENLNFFARVFNTTVEKNYDLIKDIYVQIEPFKKRRAGKLSGGMKQKLALCCALIHKPSVLFLDEPTTGVDPVSRKEFWDMLTRLKQQGITIMVSTPYMDEASLCDKIALIQEGKILSVNTPKQITQEYPYKLYSVRSDNNYKLLQQLRKRKEINSCYIFGEYLHVTFKNEKVTIEGAEVKEIEPGIEDCFIYLMNKNENHSNERVN